MKIKVCGMRNAENIKEVSALGVDFIGLIFWKQSKRYVSSESSHAGIIPDRADSKLAALGSHPALVGVFVDEMMQNVVTAAYNYKLDYIQLHGDEATTYIDNLRRTLDPDIRKGIKIIKALGISSEADLLKAQQYEGHVDMLLFDTKCDGKGGSGEKFNWDVLQAYNGELPFLLSGGIGPDDAERVKNFSHPKCVGIDLNSMFETAPALKDIEKLKSFITAIKS